MNPYDNRSLIYQNRYNTDDGELSKYDMYEGCRPSKSFERFNPPPTIISKLYEDSRYYEELVRKENSLRKTRKYKYLVDWIFTIYLIKFPIIFRSFASKMHIAQSILLCEMMNINSASGKILPHYLLKMNMVGCSHFCSLKTLSLVESFLIYLVSAIPCKNRESLWW